MNLAEINISLPVIRYTTDIVHFAPRKSTVIEWIILEVLKNLYESKDSKYKNCSVNFLFSQVFNIPDSDNLIKPCLFDLYSLGAITANSALSDNVSLNDYIIGDLLITDLGLEMQRKGLLPGRDVTQVVDFFFDIIKNKIQIASDKRVFSKEAVGVQLRVGLIDSMQIPLPEVLIMSYLDQLKKQPKVCPDWLKPETEIKSISLSTLNNPIQIYWDNNKVMLQIKDDMQVLFKNNDSIGSINPVIDYLSHAIDENIDFQNIKEINNIPDVDKFAKYMCPGADIGSIFKKVASISPIFYYNKALLKISDTELKELSAGKICIIYNDDALSITIDKGIIIHVPLQKDSAFGTEKDTGYLGLFNLKGNNYSNKVPLYFSLIDKKEDLNLLIDEIIQNYFNDDNFSLIYLLAANKRTNDFKKLLDETLASKKILNEKISLIDNVVPKAETFGIKLDKNSYYLSQIKIEDDVLNPIDKTLALLDEIKALYVFKKNDELYFKAIDKLFEVVPACKTYADLSAFIVKLKTDKKVFNYLSSSGMIQKLYSDDLLLELVDKYNNSDFIKIDLITRLESYFVNLKRNQENLEKTIGLGPFPIDSSKDFIEQHILSLKTAHDTIKECIKKNKDYVKSINASLCKRNSFIKRFDDLCSDASSSFAKIQETINFIADIIMKIYAENALNYEIIYIVDTCALMNHPEILDKFINNKAAFVVPQVVIEELDKNKQLIVNPVKAAKARSAIRSLSDYAQKKVSWLIIEAPQPENLPAAYSSDKNDNLILSVALKYKLKKVILISDDKNLLLKAKSEKIICKTTYQFLGIKKQSMEE